MIWDFQEALSRRLLLWAALSIAAGALMVAFAGSPWWRGFGIQASIWGGVDAAIALFGQRASRKRRESIAHDREAVEREARKLRRLLWINAGLDVLYVAGGALLLLTLGVQNLFMAGTGWGIIVQGGFLFFFDLLHAVGVPREWPALPALAAFDGPEHQPFILNGGEPAALLVHGFGGTPAEMRSLAEALRDEGWTAQALLLPGFGTDIARLTETRSSEWLAAVERAGQELASAGHRPLLLVGYSMGAALSLALVQTIRPAGLVALAPFRWEEKWWTPVVEFFVRPFLPIGFRPLRKADFGDPRLRQGIAKFVPGIDLDDPATQAAMRDFRVPLGLIDELRALSRRTWSAAARLDGPVLIVQGARDSVVRPPQTRRLAERLARPPRYVEVNSEHNLTATDNPVWPEVQAAVVNFARAIAPHASAAERPAHDSDGV
jgi:esterase/lipase